MFSSQPPPSNKPIIILDLEGGLSFEAYNKLIARIASKNEFLPAYNKKQAFATLNRKAVHEHKGFFALRKDTHPVLVLDAGITKPENQNIADRLAHLAWEEGRTVILAGDFSRAKKEEMMRMLGGTWGLPLKHCGVRRGETKLSKDMLEKKGELFESYSQKAVLMGYDGGIQWSYDMGEGHGGEDKGAAVLFLDYGKGKLGYVGDVEVEEGTMRCILKMLKEGN